MYIITLCKVMVKALKHRHLAKQADKSFNHSNKTGHLLEQVVYECGSIRVREDVHSIQVVHALMMSLPRLMTSSPC